MVVAACAAAAAWAAAAALAATAAGVDFPISQQVSMTPSSVELYPSHSIPHSYFAICLSEKHATFMKFKRQIQIHISH